MSDEKRFSRRRVLGTSIVGAAAVAGPLRLQETLAARKAPVQLHQLSGKLTYWGGLIFSDNANKLLIDTINQWGEDNGVETEVVMINQNETVQKVSAAVESNTMPDALDLGLDLLLLLSPQQGILAPLDDLYKKLGDAQGGWYESIDTSDRHDRDRRRPHRHSIRRVRQPALAPQRRADRGRLHHAAHDLGGTGARRRRRSTSRRSTALGSRSPMSATAMCRCRSCSPMAAGSRDDAGKNGRRSIRRKPGPISTG